MQSQTFHDFDSFVDSVRDVDCVMLIQNPQHRFWSIKHINLPEVHFQLGRLGSGNIVEGQSWPSGYLLYMPLTDTCAYSANGTVLDKNSFAILEPGCDFCISTKVDHDWCTVFVPTHLFDHCGNLVEQSSGSKKMTCRVTRANRQLTHLFKSIVRQIMIAAESPQFESSLAAACAEAELMRVASLIVWQQQNGKPHPEGRPKLQRQEIIRRSKAFFEAHERESILVGELAAAVKVSERTLRTAFNEYYGVGPIHYLQLRQIHQVHCELRAADPKAVSVTGVLMQHGQWEFGRFAARYRQLYGELPSQTLLGTKRR